jgi:hypothetical protein
VHGCERKGWGKTLNISVECRAALLDQVDKRACSGGNLFGNLSGCNPTIQDLACRPEAKLRLVECG